MRVRKLDAKVKKKPTSRKRETPVPQVRVRTLDANLGSAGWPTQF